MNSADHGSAGIYGSILGNGIRANITDRHHFSWKVYRQILTLLVLSLLWVLIGYAVLRTSQGIAGRMAVVPDPLHPGTQKVMPRTRPSFDNVLAHRVCFLSLLVLTGVGDVDVLSCANHLAGFYRCVSGCCCSSAFGRKKCQKGRVVQDL